MPIQVIYLIAFCIIVTIFVYIGLNGVYSKTEKDQEESLLKPMEYAKKLGMNVRYGTYKKRGKDVEDKTTMVIETKHSTITLRWYPSHYYYILPVDRCKSEPHFRYNLTCQYYDVILDTLDKLIDKDEDEQKISEE